MTERDDRLCEAFGVTPEEVEADALRYEADDLGGMEFGTPIQGRPEPRMRTSSVKFYDFELAAIDRAAKSQGISRSEFIRRACANELLAS